MAAKSRKFLALLLSFCCVFSLFSFSASAYSVADFKKDIDNMANDIRNDARDGSLIVADKINVDGEIVSIFSGKGAKALAMKVKSPADAVSLIWRYLNAVLNTMVNVLANYIIPGGNPNLLEENYIFSDNFYAGHEEFIDTPAQNASWSLGYANAVFTPDDLLSHDYTMGGYAINKFAKGNYDDLKVRTIAIDDGSERGAVVFCVIDTIGLANSDIREIRSRLGEYADKFAAVNIAVNHTHSGLDTQGLWARQPVAIINNLILNIFDYDGKTHGTDPALMERLYAVAAKSIKDAYDDMTEGKLYASSKDIGGYFNDKSDPDIVMNDMYRFRFEPYDGSEETIISNFGAHPETVGLADGDYTGDSISADYPYYTEEVLNAFGFNYIHIQGTLGSLISVNRGPSSDGLELDRYESTVRYGHEIGYMLLGMTLTEEECAEKDYFFLDPEFEASAMGASSNYTPWHENWEASTETELAPILNIKLSQILFEIDNPLLMGIGKLGLANNIFLIDGKKVYTETEVGYLEIGESIKVIMMPGETAPELIIGGSTMTAAGSASRTDFVFDPLVDYFSDDTTVLVFDTMNDSNGYIVPDNDYGIGTIRYDGDILTYNFDGMLSFGSKTASRFIGEFFKLAGIDPNK